MQRSDWSWSSSCPTHPHQRSSTHLCGPYLSSQPPWNLPNRHDEGENAVYCRLFKILVCHWCLRSKSPSFLWRCPKASNPTLKSIFCILIFFLNQPLKGEVWEGVAPLDFGSDNVASVFSKSNSFRGYLYAFLRVWTLTPLPFPHWVRTDWLLMVIQYHAAVYLCVV